MPWGGGENYLSQDHLSILQACDHAFHTPTPTPTPTPDSEFSSVYCFAISCTKARKKSNYLKSHGEEAQEKPLGL